MTPSRGQTNAERGFIIPIGGAVRKRRNPVILEQFLEICGRNNAVIAVIPTATKVEENGKVYSELFSAMGASKVICLNINKRTDCNRDDYLSQIEESTGIFISGGEAYHQE